MFATDSISANKGRARRSIDDELVPMINIIFLMLIFFMVAGRIEQQQPVSVPVSMHSGSVPLEKTFVTLTSNGELLWEGNTIAVDMMADFLQHTFSSDTTIAVKADKTLTAEKMKPFMQAASESKHEKIRFITLSQESTDE